MLKSYSKCKTQFGVDNIAETDILHKQLTDVLQCVENDLQRLSAPAIEAIKLIREIESPAGMYSLESVFFASVDSDREVCFVGLDTETGEITAHSIPVNIIATMDVKVIFNYLTLIPKSNMNVMHVGMDDIAATKKERIFH